MLLSNTFNCSFISNLHKKPWKVFHFPLDKIWSKRIIVHGIERCLASKALLTLIGCRLFRTMQCGPHFPTATQWNQFISYFNGWLHFFTNHLNNFLSFVLICRVKHVKMHTYAYKSRIFSQKGFHSIVFHCPKLNFLKRRQLVLCDNWVPKRNFGDTFYFLFTTIHTYYYQFINILLSNDFVLAFDSRIIATLSSGNFHIYFCQGLKTSISRSI